MKTRNALGLHMTSDDVRPTERLREQVSAPLLPIESQTYAAENLFNAFVRRCWYFPVHAFGQKRHQYLAVLQAIPSWHFQELFPRRLRGVPWHRLGLRSREDP